MGGKGSSGGKNGSREGGKNGSREGGKNGSREVYKPWVKNVKKEVSDSWTSRAGPRRSNGDAWSRRSDSGRRYSYDSPASGRRYSYDSSASGRKGGMRKGKGKGKFNKAAPLNSLFWERKVEDENREIIGEEMYSGTIERYNLRQGWGFIQPDDPDELPEEVMAKLKEANTEAEKEGKEIGDLKQKLYFRKPDVNHADGFKLTQEVAVTFSVYIDDKGAGACDVTMAEEE